MLVSVKENLNFTQDVEDTDSLGRTFDNGSHFDGDAGGRRSMYATASSKSFGRDPPPPGSPIRP
jgi:hypothetical protein